MSADKKEKSAIDAIYEILDEIAQIKSYITVINNDIKTLSNKVSKLSKSDSETSAKAELPGVPTAQAPNLKPTHIVKIFGKVVNQRKSPMKGVNIKVFSPKGEELKSRETDDEGYWEARVPPGVYSVELNASHINSKFRPINKNITVEEYMTELEVK